MKYLEDISYHHSRFLGEDLEKFLKGNGRTSTPGGHAVIYIFDGIFNVAHGVVQI
jgi:hypothetical protein